MEARYTIRAAPDPQSIPRLLNYFAQQALIPARMTSDQASDGLVTLTILQPAITHTNARIIAEKMRASVLVESVALDFVAEAVSKQLEPALI